MFPVASLERPWSGIAMDTAQHLPTSLVALDAALAAVLDGLGPIAVVDLPTHMALSCVAAEMVPLQAHPKTDVALVDGWAVSARDLVGASSYTPLPLTAAPHWVEAGDPIPNGCD